MKLKDILAKVAKGEALTDEEKAFVVAHDPEKEVNDAAAAARRKSEKDATDAQAALQAAQQKLNELQQQVDASKSAGMTESQKSQKQIETLSAQVAQLTKAQTDLQAERVKLVRQTKVDEVIRGSGVKFVPEVDQKIMSGALAAAFNGLSDEDLADPEKVKPIVGTFKAVNKAVILDTTGHGAGNPPHAGDEAATRAKKIEDMTADERRADLKKSGIL